MTKVKRKIIIFFIFTFFLCYCKSKIKVFEIKEGQLFRFIDHLEKKNIIETPLKDLMKNFELIEEDLTGKWTYLPEVSNKEYDVFGCTTKFSLLGISEEIKPEKMKLLRNGKKIKFFNETEKYTMKWKWLPAEKIVNIKEIEGYSRLLNAIILERGDSLFLETILPKGEGYIEIFSKNASPSFYSSEVELRLNNQVVRKISMDYMDYYKIPFKTPQLGKYIIELKYNRLLKKIKAPKKRKKLFIYSIKIKVPNDILLLMVPREKNLKETINSSSIKALYYVKDKKNKKYFDFYKIQKQFSIHDLGIEENPYSIKKKIYIYDRDLNCIFAPPKSIYKFKLKIYSNSFLEFGYGTLYNPSKSNVEFKILVTNFKKQDLLFFNRINDKEKLILREKIDLSKYKNNEIELYFITEGNGLSFWYNPIIYSPYRNKEDINVVLISIDTLRANHLGCYGYKRNTSPNIDAFAKEGVLFENTFAPTSWTLPSHLSMLTSLNTVHHGVYYNIQKLSSSIPTLADILRIRGYSTGAFTGGGYVSHVFGFSKGFDFYQEQKGGRFAPLRDNEARILYDICSKWIKENKEKKFFLFLHTFQTHSPYSSPSPWGEMFLDKNAKWGRIAIKNFINTHKNYRFSKKEIENIIALYDGEIRYTDEVFIMPLLKLLKDLGIYDKTMIILTSDHGEEFHDHGGWEHGRTLYNELIKVPLIIKFPYSKYRGTKISSIARIIDIVPTILEEIGINYSKYKFDGESLIKLIVVDKNRNSRIFYSDLAFKDIKNPCPALISTNFNNYKLIVDYMHNNIELYDIRKDPTEKNDISRFKKNLVRKLLSKIEDYYKNIHNIKREEIKINKDLKERLKALGYLN